jgi:hypothetical protein
MTSMSVLPQCKTIDDFACRLSDGLGKRAAKFTRDMIIGIHRSRSVNLSEIAGALDERISPHALHKRLSRNLARTELISTLADRLLHYSAAAVTSETRLVVTSYGIDKPHARQMQYLQSRSDDASEEDGSGSAYRVCEIIANDPGSNQYIPLLTTLWSRHAPGYVSDADAVRQAIDRVLAATGQRGVLAMDAVFLPSSIIEVLIRIPHYRFVATGFGTVQYRRHARDIRELTEQCDTPFGGTIFKVHNEAQAPMTEESLLLMHFGSIPVQLSDSSRPLSLVALKTTFTSGKSGKNASLLTSEPKPRSRQAHMAVILTFLAIRDVADTLKNQKRDFHPEDFRVLTYSRLQLLMTLLQCVVFFESRSMVVQKQVASLKPIEGNYVRDFLLPGEVEALRNS